MLEGDQRQEAANVGKPADGRRCRFSWRHVVFVVLVFGAVFFFYSTDVNTAAPNWNPKLWMQNWSRFRGGYEASPIRTDLEVQEVDAAFNSSTPSANATARSLVSTPVPYVSPGPYLVEYPHRYRFVMNEPRKCEQEEPFVVLMVPVAPLNRQHRDVIRTTWGGERSASGRAVSLLFVLGLQSGDEDRLRRRSLAEESERHHDLLQADFLDCYKNLTIKTMLMLEWLDAHCPGAAYAMKVDSDVFLNVPRLVSMLLDAPRSDYMTGLVAEGAQVLRDPSSKWFLPVDLYPDPHYPRYALGLGYVLSLDLPKKLLEASRHVKPLYIEDVYLGLCMQRLGVAPTSSPNWNDFNVFPVPYSRCAYSGIVVTTTQPGADRVRVWEDFKKPGPYC